MSTAVAAPPVRFHLSLNVSDLPRAVAFFERVLGVPAVKQRVDYAKFELASPPLVFSLEPRSPAVNGSLNHVGFRFADAAQLVDVQQRLEAAGIATQREEGVECCYARQTKFWVHDLDQRLWEFYVLEGDLEHRGAGQTMDAVLGSDEAAAPPPTAEPVVYEHFMGRPLVLPEEPCDEIRLRGTFNLPVTDDELRQTLRAVFQRLRPGGKVHLHQLTADTPVADDALQLPGRAAVVKHVPVRTELRQALRETGFVQTALTKFGSRPCFEVAGGELRETMIEARRPAERGCAARFDVVYKGPFAQLADDEGHVFRRGERTAICSQTWQVLEAAGMAGQFTWIAEPTGQGASCGVTLPSCSTG